MARHGRPFWSAINLPAPPAPAAAGAAETSVAKGLAAGRYFFAVKSHSRAHAQSDLSNVATAEVK